MAVEVKRRPESYWFNPNQVTSAVALDNNGKVNIRSTAHGLSDGAVLYIKTDVQTYNGFFYVRTADANLFYIQTTEIPYSGLTADCVDYVRATSVVQYHGAAGGTIKWSCIHLPIVYKLSSDLWPTNSADTVRTISSVTDSSGYCALSLSGDIKATGSAAALEFVKITNATDDDLNGVWQITSYTNDTTFVISIPYSSANDTALTGASIQYYYNNYHVKVQVWGGLNIEHTYYAQEPYELLATLNLVPDSTGLVVFSISEVLMSNVAIRNNLLLGTLPNNLDAFTMFFIKYAEVYDDSDGTTLSTITPSYTSDLSNFEGFAVNAKLPFKNVFSGSMSEYISENTSQKFLTLFDTPVIFEDKYFDLSFLLEIDSGGIAALLSYYNNNILQDTEINAITYSGSGVYRQQITDADCEYDRINALIYKTIFTGNTEGLLTPDNWTSLVTGSNIAYEARTTTYFEANETGTPYNERAAYQSKTVSNGSVLTFAVKIVIDVTGTNPLQSIDVRFYLNDAASFSGATDFNNFTYLAVDGEHTEYVSITSTKSNTFLISQVVLSGLTTGSANVKVYPLVSTTETKSINVNCDCLKAKATGYYLSWFNYLVGFDYWYFTAYADNIIDITEAEETEDNIFPEWPNSYGEFSDTIRKQTFRNSREQVLVRSQHVTESQLQAIKHIKTSPLVQIVNSIYDRRTVIVDADSFTYLKEGNNLYEISFTITYTDDVPSQKV